MTLIAALILGEIAATLAVAWLAPNYIRSLLMVNMLFVPIFGQRLIEVGGLVSNLGNFFYATAIFALALEVEVRGRKRAVHACYQVLAGLTWLLIVATIIHYLPPVPGNAERIAAYAALFQPTVHIVTAAYLAMLVSFAVLVFVIDRYRARSVLAYTLLIAPLLLMDSVIFFPIAFISHPWDVMVDYAVAGAAFKVVMGALTIPAFALAVRWEAKQ